MCYFMRRTLIIIFSFILTDSFAQISVDTSVKHQYDSAYKKLSSDIRKNLERTQNELLKSYNKLSAKSKKNFPFSPLNIAKVTLHTIDTLNKGEVKSGNYFYQKEKYPIMFCDGGLISDTLGIVLYPGVAQNSSINITHLIVHDTVRTEYDEWIKYDTIFRTSLQQEKTNALTLPFTTSKFVLSDTNFVVGKTIYGYADILSKTYYQDNESFKIGYIARSLHFRYYFKFVVKKNST